MLIRYCEDCGVRISDEQLKSGAARETGENHYVLPRTGKMHVEAHAFFSEALFERTEESMWQQIAAAASYPGVIGAYMMPDAHSGYGVPVGCVVVTDRTIIQVVHQPAAVAAAQVLGVKVTSPVAVSQLTLPRRISIARVQQQGLRASMRVKEGTNVVRIAIYKARNGKKAGSALYVTNRVARAGLLRVTLRSRGLLAKLRAGTYVMEVRSGQSLGSLGATRRIAFAVTP